jgi:hypothetical protein
LLDVGLEYGNRPVGSDPVLDAHEAQGSDLRVSALTPR